MARQLVVLVGAGASWDCVSDRGNPRHRAAFQPPLVRDLFEDQYRDILDHYPLAQAVAADVWPRVRGDGDALVLEDFLREELLNSSLPHRRAQYWSTPLYLQELLHLCGLNYTTHPDNFDRLVNHLLHGIERVVFVTLNYDTILDRVIGKYFPINTMDDYVARSEIALIKLHGSVNWGRRFDATEMPEARQDGWLRACQTLASNPSRVSTEIELLAPAPGPSDVEELRKHSVAGFAYPALAAPLGPDDEPACPAEHVEVLRRTLNQHSYGYDLHLLIIGYSCLDKTPLELIKSSGSRIASLVVVNGNEAAAQSAFDKFSQYMPGVAPCPRLRPDDHVELFNGGLTEYSQPDRLRSLVERVRAAP